MEASEQRKQASLTPEVIMRYRFIVLTGCSIVMSLSMWGWFIASLYLGVDFPWYGIAFMQLFSLLGYAYYAITKNYIVLRRAQLIFILISPLVAQLSLESGQVSIIMLWGFLTPVAVSMVAAREERHTHYWLLSFLGMLGLAYLLQPILGYETAAGTEILIKYMLPANIATFAVLLTLGLSYSLRHRQEINQLRKHQFFHLQHEHTQLNTVSSRSAELLKSVLPERIATRLMEGGNMIADGHSDVSVIFVDIVGFTKLADSMSPKQIVRLLNQLFSGFDEIAERHGLEKIKTIGDAFLAVGGLSNSDHSDYVEASLRAAQDFQSYIREQTQGMFHNSGLDIHTGIATGPIAAGVIGKLRLSYDIWGNTVNLASRLSDHAVAGQILVDQTTYKRTSKKFNYVQEDDLVLKGEMHVPVYRLKNAIDSLYPADRDKVIQVPV